MSRNSSVSLFAALLLATFSGRAADDPNSNEAIRKALEAKYNLTKTTADKSDIVTAGAVVVLQKDHLLMSKVSGVDGYQNRYKDGQITQNAAGKLARRLGHLPGIPGTPTAPSPGTREFVSGEKMWVTKIEVKDEKVSFTLFTDAISDVRYQATLTFFDKGRPPVDQVEKAVAEVFKVQPAEDDKSAKEAKPAQGQKQAQAAPAAQTAPPAPITPPAPVAPAADAPPPPIAPPPPVAPDPEPTKLGLGQTPDQVIAALGQPKSIAKITEKKQIYIYKDLKVTFVNGKVSDVQ
jgi:hypothetical protein